MTFFLSDHCQTHAHCEVCRARLDGAAWRASIAAAFDGIDGRDFVCPEGRSWTDHVPAGTQDKGKPGPTYMHVRLEILRAPRIGLWPALKDSLRVTEAMINLHKGYTDCWRARQRRRIVQQYVTAKEKMGHSTAPAEALQQE